MLIEADCKDWSGRVKAEDSTLDGLKFTDGNRIDLNVYLENNGGNDYNIGDNATFVTLTGRLGSGTTNNNTSYWLRSGGNDRQVKGDTIGVIETIANTNMQDTSSEFMTRVYQGSSAETMYKERYFGNGVSRYEAIDRTDGVTVLAMFGLSPTDGSFLYGNGTLLNKMFVGNGTPEAAVTGNVGDMYSRQDGGAGTTLYVKETGTGNTGWAAK